MRRLVALLLACAGLSHAEDARLSAIRTLLVPMRTSEPGLKARGATPAFTTVKHQLRDWIESRLLELKWNGERWNPNPIVLQEQLNGELDRAGLLFHVPTKPGGWGDGYYGFLGRIVFDMKPGDVLVLETSVGIQMCGYDESAYAYQQSDGKWRRFWESEQDDYTEDKYFPQSLREVAVSAPDFHRGSDKFEHLIATVGFNPWCTSNWQTVYYSIWRTRTSYSEPLLLLEGREVAWQDEPSHAAAGRRDAFVEYAVSDIEGGFRRPELRHYVLRDSKLERTDPVAMSPRNFVAFWLTDPWTEVSHWTDESSRAKLLVWLEHHRGPFHEFDSPTLHCRTHPDMWQLSARSGEKAEQEFYFLIRWRPPYRFTMISVSDSPSPDCTEKDPEAGRPLSLFPPQ